MKKFSFVIFATSLFFSNNLIAQELDKECNIKKIGNNYYEIKCPMTFLQEDLKDRDFSGQADYEVEAKTNFAAANFAIVKNQKWFLIKDYNSSDQYLKNGRVIYTGTAKFILGNNKMPNGAQNAKTFINTAN